jgi:hypothetical protein
MLRGHSLTTFTIFSSFLANYLCTPVDICANLYLHNDNTKIFVDNLVLSLRNRGTSINDVPRFLAIFDLPTYLVLLYNVPFWGLSWTPLPSTLISDIINGRSLVLMHSGTYSPTISNVGTKSQNQSL